MSRTTRNATKSVPRKKKVTRKAQRPRARSSTGYAENRKAYLRASKRADYEPSLGRSLLEGGGEMLASTVGLGPLGRTAGRHLSHLFGFGDYRVNSNVFLSGSLPRFYNMPSGGGTIIRFQEYLGDVITSPTANTFSLSTYLLNPANERTFPWLGQLAANYEQYSFEGIVFEFRSTSADALNSTNTALGTVMMATQYDVADNVFSSKAEMLNYEFSNSVKPSESCLHMIECAPRQSTLTELYTNAGSANPAGTDPRFYNLGRFSIATTGFQGTSVNVGELHVTYQVRLMKPKLNDGLGFDNETATWNCIGCSSASTFGTMTQSQANDLSLSFPTSSSFSFPAEALSRTYYCVYQTTGNAAVATAFTLGAVVVTNGAITAYNAIQSPDAGVVCKAYAWAFVVVTQPGQLCTVSVPITFAQSNNGLFRVMGVPNGFL